MTSQIPFSVPIVEIGRVILEKLEIEILVRRILKNHRGGAPNDEILENSRKKIACSF